MKRRSGSNAVFLLLAIFAVALPGAAAALQVDPARVPTRILYDLVVPVAHVERFDGSSLAPPADAATLRQAAHELTRASLESPAWPDASAFRDDGGTAVRIGMLDVRYDRIREGADRSGAARVDGDRLVLDAGALETAHAFIAAPTRGYTYRGGEVSFVLDSRWFVGSARPARVEVDFDDGRGYRLLKWDERVTVPYWTTGRYAVRLRAFDTSGEALHANFAFDVRSLATPAPDDTLLLSGTQPYNGGTATGRAFVYLSDLGGMGLLLSRLLLPAHRCLLWMANPIVRTLRACGGGRWLYHSGHPLVPVRHRWGESPGDGG